MNKTVNLIILPGMLLLLSLPGCKEQQTVPADSGVVEANQAYLNNFGAAPHETVGRAFARVGYLPLQNNPEQVRALPLFLFGEQDQLRQILDRLTSGTLFLPPETELYNPFPSDLKVTVTSPENETVTLALTTAESWSADDLRAAVTALTETAVQFPDITRVRISLNGELLPRMPEGGFMHSPRHLLEVGPPTLIMVVGMWDKGAEALDEILVEFDRPVTVNSFQLYDKAGKKVDGEYFTSAFNMAVVVHPQDPGRYRDGTVLRAEWDVVDTLGRSNKGTSSVPLHRVEH